MDRRDEIVSTDILLLRQRLYIPTRENSISFSAWEGGIGKNIVTIQDNIGN